MRYSYWSSSSLWYLVILLPLGYTILTVTGLQTQDKIAKTDDRGPSETECLPYIEKALKELTETTERKLTELIRDHDDDIDDTDDNDQYDLHPTKQDEEIQTVEITSSDETQSDDGIEEKKHEKIETWTTGDYDTHQLLDKEATETIDTASVEIPIDKRTDEVQLKTMSVKEGQPIEKPKKNKWWSIDRDTIPKKVDIDVAHQETPIRRKNKWWKTDDEDKPIEDLTEMKPSAVIDEGDQRQFKKKQNKWWHTESDDDKDVKNKAEKTDDTAKVSSDDDTHLQMKAKHKGNKWWHFDSDEVKSLKPQKKTPLQTNDNDDDVEYETLKTKHKGNKWWHFDSDEVTASKSRKRQIDEDAKIMTKMDDQRQYEELKAKHKGNKWWHFEGDRPAKEDVKKKIKHSDVDDADVHYQKMKAKHKGNKWWHFESDEREHDLDDPQHVESEQNELYNTKRYEELKAMHKGNKWWHFDLDEDAFVRDDDEHISIDEKIERQKAEDIKLVYEQMKAKYKGNKWWHFDSDEVTSTMNEQETPTKTIRQDAHEEDAELLYQKRKELYKHNKWWHFESDEDDVEETIQKSTEQMEVDDFDKVAYQKLKEKHQHNKWWHFDLTEDKDSGKVERDTEDAAVAVDTVDTDADQLAYERLKAKHKHNKWWRFESSESPMEMETGQPVEMIANDDKEDATMTRRDYERLKAKYKGNKWWRFDSDEADEAIETSMDDVDSSVDRRKQTEYEDFKLKHKHNKWWRFDADDTRDDDDKETLKRRPDDTGLDENVRKSDEDTSFDETAPKVRNKWWSVDRDDMVLDVYISTEQPETEETVEQTESDLVPEEELTLASEPLQSEIRSREHVEHLLKLDQQSSRMELIFNKIAQGTLRELKQLYERAIKPLEILYKYRDLSNRHFGDAEIFSKPLILFMGPWSGGKSSMINYLLNTEYNDMALHTGAEPSPAYFNILMYGDKVEIVDGTQLTADFIFSGLQKFGQGLEERLRGIKLPSRLLEKVNIVEIPGILEVRKQVSRAFPFNDACQWFIDRADIIFLVYDPSKLDVGPETEAILDQLKGREHQTRIVLNKADQVKPEELMRVQSALIWNISPLMSSPQPPIMYTASMWSRPFEPWAPVRLLLAQERALLRDLRTAIEKRIDNKIASARRFAVRVRNHAKMVDCYLTTYYNQKSVFNNRKYVADEIVQHPQKYHIYEGLSTLTNISRYDLPDPDVYRDFFQLNQLYEFQQLSSTCTYFRGCPINRLDMSIAYDLPELLGRHKRQIAYGPMSSERANKKPSSTRTS